MQGNPERPYAQLLTPAAKSQKLLLRLQHKKLLSAREIARAQAVFTLWQKLLQKNIPSAPWPEFADLLLFPDEKYIALLLHPFECWSAVQAAMRLRHLDGYLLVDQRPEAQLLTAADSHLIIAGRLADRIGARAWSAASRDLTPWQDSLMAELTIADEDAALDLLGLFRQGTGQSPWDGHPVPEQLLAPICQAYFAIWRARGNVVKKERVCAGSPGIEAALEWLKAAAVIETADGGFRLRQQCDT